jgi:hypothetical protein
VDNNMMNFVIGFAVFIIYATLKTLRNIRDYTTSPGRLQFKSDKKRSLKEMKDYIFGKDATLLQMMFPFF